MDESITIDVHPDNKGSADAWNGADGQHWVDHADTYDRSLADHTPALLEAADIGHDHVVLDVGCGSGHLTLELGHQAPAGRAIGIDVSRPLVRDARARASAVGAMNVEFVLGDAQVHPFEPNVFDVVVSRTGTMYFGDQVTAFANLGGGVRPGGRLAVLVWQGIDANEWFRDFNDALDAGRPPVRPPAGVPGPFVFARPEHARAVLEAAGWADIRCESHQGPMWFGPDPAVALEFVSSQGFTKFRLSDVDATAREEALEALGASLRAHHASDGVTYDSGVWVIRARRP